MGVKLTKKTVEAMSAPTSGYTFAWDSDVRGFGVRITASGVKSYILQTRINGREKRITIGRCNVMAAETARDRAKVLLGEVANGGDPVARKQREKLEDTSLDRAFEDYLKTKDLKSGTVDDMRIALAWAFDDWRKLSITGITRRMVERRYLELVERSKARANVSFRYLRAVLNLAMTRYRDTKGKSVLSENPVRTLTEARMWRKVGRRRTVLSPDDLKSWLPAILRLGEVPERERGQGKLNPKLRSGEVYRDLFLFLALTGARKSEAFNLKKDDVDFSRETLIFRDTKNRNHHELPLTPYLRNLLRQRIADSPGDRIFTSPHDGRPVTNLRYAIDRVKKETGLHFTPHDLRRLCATSLERQGIPTYTVKAILNHLTSASDVTGGYVQVDLGMKRAALETLENFIMRHIGRGGKVVELRRARG